MELSKLTKSELLIKCEELGIKKCKSKSKDDLVKLIESLSNENSEASVSNNNIVSTTINNASITIENMCGLEYLKTLDPNSIDLILTDPPYIISKTSGLDKHYNNVKYNEENNINEVKTEEQWVNYKQQNNIEDDSQKDNYIKYGSLYGKKYCVKTDYGNWDSDFTLTTLEKFIENYYKPLFN